MTDTTPRAGAPLLAAAQAQKHVTHNEALYQFDAFLCANFLSRALAAPPGTLNDGDTWLVAASASGDWVGHDGAIAYRADGGWRFYAPFAGLVAYVADESALIVYAGGAWVDYASVLALQNVPLLGVNTTADSTNKLAAKSASVLFDHVGNGVQAKLNKHATADTASLLYQTSYSGRAELGLCGDDDFHLKVSPDGASWTEALHVTGAGNVGIGTAAPGYPLTVSGQSELVGNVGIGAAPRSDTWLYLKGTITNASNNGAYLRPSTVVTASGTNYINFFQIDASDMEISSGATDSGYRVGFQAAAYAGSALFQGTLAAAYGSWNRAGISVAGAGGAMTNVYGTYSEVLNSSANGTITNAYGVYISNSDTAGTISKRFDLYASSANARNYFAGDVGIGTAVPSYKAHVNGTFGVAPGSSVSPANNGDVVFELTSNTTLTIKARGSDGTVRSGTLALS
ncbi:MAG: DUF2793 domain-containing protein [Alphaproteobacteria bacterium]|nr:DUF2793 domain-containing protein [Alphaproteobacteria bacterium]